MEVVGTYLQLFEAEAVCAALRAAGIPAEIPTRNTSVNIPYLTAPGIRVTVPIDQLATARELLARLQAEAEQADGDDDDDAEAQVPGRVWSYSILLGYLALNTGWRVLEYGGDWGLARATEPAARAPFLF